MERKEQTGHICRWMALGIMTAIIIMELFINKMRRLKGIRKMIVIEEAWLRHVSLVYDCLTFHSTRWK